MRIEKTDMEFVTFDAQDVIMTSTTTGGNDDDMLSMIWLNESSIGNYNDLVPAGGHQLKVGSYEGYLWIAFSGTMNKSQTLYLASAGQDPTPDKGIYTVSKDNQAEYEAVLSWLQSHSGQ